MFWSGVSFAQMAVGFPFMAAALVWAFLGGVLVDSALKDLVKR